MLENIINLKTYNYKKEKNPKMLRIKPGKVKKKK